MDQGALAAVPKNFKDKVQCRGYNLDTSQPGAIFEEDARAILEEALRRISEPVGGESENAFVAVCHQNQSSIVFCTFHIQTLIFAQRAPENCSEFLNISQNTFSSRKDSAQVGLSFKDQLCMDCGQRGDKRLMTSTCHLMEYKPTCMPGKRKVCKQCKDCSYRCVGLD